MKLLIATFNKGKLEDYKDFSEKSGIEIVNLKDAGIKEDFNEIHNTMEENAKGKAEYYNKLTGLPTLADDSGIEIPFYHMQPGVHTKRWGGHSSDSEEYRKFILERVKAIPPDRRQAQLRAVLAFCNGTETVLEEGIIKGELSDQPYTTSRTQGYPWDQLFVIPEIKKFYEELTPEENLKYNHRKLAFDRLKERILVYGQGTEGGGSGTATQ